MHLSSHDKIAPFFFLHSRSNDFKGDILNYDEGDEELNELLEEAKERNSDLLSDENELNMVDNVEFC